VSTTPRQSITPATVAEWRRRREASAQLSLPADNEQARNGSDNAKARNGYDNEKGGNGFRVPAYAGTLHSTDAATNGFAESQQAGITAMISLAKADAAPRPLPAVNPPAPRPEPPASPTDRATRVALDRSEPVIAPAAPEIARLSVPVRPATPTPGRLTARRAQTSQWRRAFWNSRSFLQARPLTVILIAQVVLALRLVWSNTAFPDEALYLWSGRLVWAHWLHGTSLPNFPDYFSGAPVVYPPLGAVAAAVGGLTGGRLLSLCFMLSTTALLHGVTRRLFDRRSADFAAALFAGLGAVQFLGAFATYDAMALMLLALATWLSMRAAERGLLAQIPLLIGTAGALALADAAKYAATLFDPVVILVAGLAAWRARSRKNGVLAVMTISWVLCLLLFLGIRLGGHAYWRGIAYTTLTRAHGTSSAGGIVADSFGWAALIVILAVIGSAVVIAKPTQLPTKLCACVLACAITLAPANQARIHVFTSLYKHVGFGAWFAAAVAGYALASLAGAVPAIKQRGALRASTGLAVAGLLLGASLAQTHFASWPNTTSFVAHLRPLLPAHKGRVLAADNGNVIEFYLPDELQGMIFSGPWFLRYQDPETGKYLAGLPAYRDAIKHRYFSVIALSFGDSRAMDEVISNDIRTYGGYQLIATLPYRAAGQSGAFRIWVREESG
jgi:hypothetical protein